MAAKKPTAEEAMLDAQLHDMMTAVGAVTEAEAPEPKAAPKSAAKPAAAGWGPKTKK
jgi:hypothetical protein